MKISDAYGVYMARLPAITDPKHGIRSSYFYLTYFVKNA